MPKPQHATDFHRSYLRSKTPPLTCMAECYAISLLLPGSESRRLWLIRTSHASFQSLCRNLQDIWLARVILQKPCVEAHSALQRVVRGHIQRHRGLGDDESDSLLTRRRGERAAIGVQLRVLHVILHLRKVERAGLGDPAGLLDRADVLPQFGEESCAGSAFDQVKHQADDEEGLVWVLLLAIRRSGGDHHIPFWF